MATEFAGYRFATRDDWSFILTAAGLPTFTSNTSGFDAVALAFFGLVGETESTPFSLRLLTYLDDDATFSGPFSLATSVRLSLSSNNIFISDFNQSNSEINSLFASALIRNETASVPEPTVLFLIGTGLFGFIGMRRKSLKTVIISV